MTKALDFCMMVFLVLTMVTAALIMREMPSQGEVLEVVSSIQGVKVEARLVAGISK